MNGFGTNAIIIPTSDVEQRRAQRVVNPHLEKEGKVLTTAEEVLQQLIICLTRFLYTALVPGSSLDSGGPSQSRSVQPEGRAGRVVGFPRFRSNHRTAFRGFPWEESMASVSGSASLKSGLNESPISEREIPTDLFPKMMTTELVISTRESKRILRTTNISECRGKRIYF